MVADLSSRYSFLNVLINNAGTNQKTRQLTEQGIELTFAVNYLAPLPADRPAPAKPLCR